MKLQRLYCRQPDFNERLSALLFVDTQTQSQVREQVAAIIADVRYRGDQALLHYSKIFDRTEADSVAALKITTAECKKHWNALDSNMRRALQTAHERIKRYGERQKLNSWSYQDSDGSHLGQQVNALDSVGIYVPGGKAAYPSSVMMSAVPAKVAGVPRVVMVVPSPGGIPNPLVLATAGLCNVDEVWLLGGAHAVAALAYGTETIVPVDKITGPGNQYVAEAKRAVFGKVGIDMIAGPSEVVVIADESVPAQWITADLFAQAEHDEMAQSILITTSEQVADAVEATINTMLPEQPRVEVITASLQNRGAIIVADSPEQAIDTANRIAPEHLELMLCHAEKYVADIRHAGAIFVGAHSNEVFGDYCAGPNHVLPTSGTARFASPLGVYDFQKRSTVMQLSHDAAYALSPIANCLAQGEGLHAHALSARLRGKN